MARGAAPRIHVFADEASVHGRVDYFAVGGVWATSTQSEALRARLSEICSIHKFRSDTEFKWTKVSGKKAHPAYYDLVDAFAQSGASFNALAVRYDEQGLQRFGDFALDYYKWFYWLLLKRTVPESHHFVTLDRRTDLRSDRLETLRSCLNAATRYEGANYRVVAARDSKKEPIVQVADVLLGALCFHLNGCHLDAAASGGKSSLALHMAERFLRSQRLGATARGVTPFNVWRWRPSN